MKVVQLKTELSKRGESVTGLLRERLQEKLKEVLTKNQPEMIQPSTFILAVLESPPSDVVINEEKLYVLTENGIRVMCLDRTGNGLNSQTVQCIAIDHESLRSLAIAPNHKAFVTTKNSVLTVSTESPHVDVCAKSTSPFGVGFLKNRKSIVFSDQEEKVIKEISFDEHGNANVNILAGKENTTTSKDGTSNTCQFSQPTGIFGEGNTLYICDTAPGRIRIMTQPDGLALYLKHIGNMLRAFKIKMKKEKEDNLTLQEVISIIEQTHHFFESVHTEAKVRCNKEHVQGPDGSPPKNTIESVEIVLASLRKLKELLATENPNYALDVKTLMTLVCERLFAIMRSQYEMLTTLQFMRHFAKSITETLKSIISVGFHYFTSEVKAFYPVPSSFIKFTDLPKLPKPAVDQVSKASEDRLKGWALENGQSVRQQSVRSLSTKDTPGTLPIELYEAPKEVYQPLDLSNETPVINQNDQPGVRFEKGSVLVFKDTSSEKGFVIGFCKEDVCEGTTSAEFSTYSVDPDNDMKYILQPDSMMLKDISDVIKQINTELVVGDVLTLEDDTLSHLIMEINGKDRTETPAALQEMEAEESSSSEKEDDDESSSDNEAPIFPVRSGLVSQTGRPIVRPHRFRDN